MDSANDLLSHYVENGSDAAFAEVVNRYLNFVYSIAARRLGSPNHEAIQDVVQTVFLALAQKAGQLRKESNLGGWLHRHTCFVTSKHLRAEHQRLKRERAAACDENQKPDSTWSDLSPVIDDAIQDLSETDKAAVLMRFFEGIDFRTIGAKLGVTEDAAQKRVSRATGKLREVLAGNGIRVSALSLGTLLAAHSLQAAPPDWAPILAGNIRHLHRPVCSAKPPGIRGTLKLVATTVIVMSVLVIGLFWQHSRSDSSLAIAGELPAKQNEPPPATPATRTIEPASQVVTNDKQLFLKVVESGSTNPIPNVALAIRIFTEADDTKSQTSETEENGSARIVFPVVVGLSNLSNTPGCLYWRGLL